MTPRCCTWLEGWGRAGSAIYWWLVLVDGAVMSLMVCMSTFHNPFTTKIGVLSIYQGLTEPYRCTIGDCINVLSLANRHNTDVQVLKCVKQVGENIARTDMGYWRKKSMQRESNLKSDLETKSPTDIVAIVRVFIIFHMHEPAILELIWSHCTSSLWFSWCLHMGTSDPYWVCCTKSTIAPKPDFDQRHLLKFWCALGTLLCEFGHRLYRFI